MSTFMERCIADPTHIKEIDTYIERWNQDLEEQRLLHEYLGMSWKEYQTYSGIEDNLSTVIRERLSIRSIT